MQRAKRYVEKFVKALATAVEEGKDMGPVYNEQVALVVSGLMQEVDELMQRRKVTTKEGIWSILKQQNKKYVAICRLLKDRLHIVTLNRLGFKELVLDVWPEEAPEIPAWVWKGVSYDED